MATTWTFDVVAPSVPLGAGLAALKQAILAARPNPVPVSFSADDFIAFSPRLEGHWGPLHKSLPEFFAAVLAGRWDASLSQSVPTSLLGDFGEFLGVRAFQATLSGTSRVARVQRAATLKRPDFVVLDVGSSRLTALECKAHSVNGIRLRAQTRRGARVSINWCSSCCGRRDAGLAQIGSEAVDLTPSPGGKFRASVRNYRNARVMANASAIVTPFFADGRLRPWQLFDRNMVSAPRGCVLGSPAAQLRCPECVLGGAAPMILAPIFHNSALDVRPITPSEGSEIRWFDAYADCGKALWAKNQAHFEASWSALVAGWPGTHAPDERVSVALQPLLDIVARAAEIGLDVWPALHALQVADGALQRALIIHSLRTVPLTEAAAQAEGGRDVSDGIEGPPRRDDRRPVTATPELPPASVALPKAAPTEVEPVGVEQWLSNFSVPHAERRRQHRDLPPITSGRGLAWVDEIPDDELTLRGALVDGEAALSIYRAPRDRTGPIEVRMAAPNADDARLAIARLIASDEGVPQTVESIAEITRRAISSTVRVRDREAATSSLFEGHGRRIERAWADDEGSAVLVLRPTD